MSFTAHPCPFNSLSHTDHVRPHTFIMKPKLLHLSCEALYARSSFLSTLFSFLVSTQFILPFMNRHTCYAPAPHTRWSFHFNTSSEKILAVIDVSETSRTTSCKPLLILNFTPLASYSVSVRIYGLHLPSHSSPILLPL